MQDVTDKKRTAVLCAVVLVGALGIFLGAVLFPLLRASIGVGMAVGILLFYGAAVIAVIVGILAALRQRLQELSRGEEEDAKKY